MTAEGLIGLIFITTAVFGRLICTAIDMGLFDRIAISLANYIVSQNERLEGKDI